MMWSPEKAPFFPSTRLGLAMVGFFGCMVIYSLRVDLSVALVCMVNRTDESLASVNGTPRLESDCHEVPINANDTTPPSLSDSGELNWSKGVQGNVLGAFFWGYLLTQVLGGWLAHRFGATVVLGLSVLLGALLTFLTPLFSRLHYSALVVLRILLGFLQGVTFPAFHTFWSHWAPPLERSKLTGINYAGAQIGNVITMPIAGLLCDYGFAGGWPSIFYVFGILAFVWVIVWFLLVRDTPSKHKRISLKEKAYIISTLAHQSSETDKKIAVPWRQVLRSVPVWAAVAGHFAGDWGAYIMLTCLPSFMKDVLKFDMTSLGFLASIPYIAYFVCINVGGFLADYIRTRGILSTKNTRKAAMTVALGLQAAFLVGAGYCGCGQEALVVALLTLGMGFSGFQYAGFMVNYMDLAPVHAGTILGIGNTLSCFCGILAPYAMGAMTPNKSPKEWRGLFWLTAAILLVGVVIFDIFADGQIQDWAVIDSQGDEEMRELKQGETGEEILKPSSTKDGLLDHAEPVNA